ncbi:MAG: glycerophosphodiester phosphodiesterase [Deltaproteobacteria bacterium]|nr:glycerophosphodiester phosphodiesterase [Deltaproteobacteria bacterium]
MTSAATATIRARSAAGELLRIAHRGASGRVPENTCAAFAAALALGVDAIELDCQLSADGVPVVIHDETLERTTSGIGPVAVKRWDELAALDAGAWRGPTFRGERIPRLADVLAQLDGRVVLNVEIKSARDVGAIEAPLVALVAAHDALSWVLFSSFHEAAVRNVRAASTDAAIGVLWDRRPATGALALADELHARCIVPSRRLVTPELIAAAHARDLGVWVWTVNDVAEMRRLVAAGVDALFSDYPERFAEL